MVLSCDSPLSHQRGCRVSPHRLLLLHLLLMGPFRLSGKSWEEKVEQVRDYMKEADVEVLLVSALDEVAWLFNLRGSDIPHTPGR